MDRRGTPYMETDIRDIVDIIRRRILIIILAAVVGAGVFGAYSVVLAKPVYESTAKIYVLTQSTSLTSFADIQISSSLAKDFERMIISRPVVRKVKEQMHVDYTYEDIVGSRISITNPEDTRVLEITCRSNDPKEAAKMANAFATVSKRQIAEIMDTDEPKIYERAVVSNTPVSPQTKRNVAVGFVLGAILAALLAVAAETLNSYIRTEADVERLLKLNVIATIPYEQPVKDDE